MEADASVYYGSDGEFLIFPQAIDSIGWLCAVNEPERLTWNGAGLDTLGEKILKCLAISPLRAGFAAEEISAEQQSTGANSFHDFSKTHHLVSVESLDGQQIQVQFLYRNANYIYALRKNDPPDWAVVLPVTAAPEAVGAAVISVLQAGGVPIESKATQSPTGNSGSLIDSDAEGGVTYDQFKASLLTDYYHLLDTGDEPTSLRVGRLIDEAMYSMGKNSDIYACVIITVATICLQEGFLLDYLNYPAHHVADISDHLTGDALACYRNDEATLGALLTRTQYTVVTPEYPPEAFDAWEKHQLAE